MMASVVESLPCIWEIWIESLAPHFNLQPGPACLQEQISKWKFYLSKISIKTINN